MREIRAGSGLGDTLYLQSIVQHMLQRGQQVIPRSNYPEVFKPLGVQVTPQRKDGNPIIAHYVTRKHAAGTSQFQDMCIMAGIREPVEMRLDWRPANTRLLEGLTRPIIAVMLPRLPMDRSDGFGAELMPNWDVMQKLINVADGSKVLIGKGQPVYQFKGIDRDLSNKTTVSELIDVASMVDGFIGICSFMIPLAESLGKPFFALWSSRGLVSKTSHIRAITPQKIIHRKDLGHYVVDNAAHCSIEESFKVFLRQVTRS